ncbi:MAG TPA: PH domain-containing protein [Chthonomonadales bacterium]|nr:PH domain-containing protein [Chthonomonadales bacterium]
MEAHQVPAGSGARALVLARRVSGRSFAAQHAGAVLLGALVAWGGLATGAAPAIYVVPIAIAPILLTAVRAWILRLSAEYRVYHDSLEAETGILSRRIDNLQLFRVRDIALSQSLLGRILRYGDIAVTSTDRSTPHFTLRGIDDPRGLYEKLREMVTETQAMRRTLIMEDDTTGGSPSESAEA